MSSNDTAQHAVEIVCSRCRKTVQGMRAPGMTGGFYDLSGNGGWAMFARPGEKRLCDACMHGSPEYQLVYGLVTGAEDTRDTPRGRMVAARMKSLAKGGAVEPSKKPYLVGSHTEPCAIFGPKVKSLVTILPNTDTLK